MSDRIPPLRYGCEIGAALDMIPRAVRQRLSHVRFVAGVDPVFAGVHSYEETDDGRSYRDTACCCHPWHLASGDRVTTIVLPTADSVAPDVVIHEMGHALHESIGFGHVPAVAVSEYAESDAAECFAEAWTAWALHAEHGYSSERTVLYERCPETVALFEVLSGEGW